MTTADLLAVVTPRRLWKRPATIWGHFQIAAAVVVLALMAALVSSETDSWRVGSVAIPDSDLTQFDEAAAIAFTTSAGMRSMADDLVVLRLQSESPASAAIATETQEWATQLDELAVFLTRQRSDAAVATLMTAQQNLVSIDRTLNSLTWQPAFLDSSSSLLNQTASSLDEIKAEVLRLESVERTVAARTLETASENAISQLGLRVAAFAGIGVTVALAVVALGFGVAQASATRASATRATVTQATVTQATRNSNSMAPSTASMRSVSVARTRFTRKLGSVVQSGLTAVRRTVMAVLVRLTMI
jgi:hypothetical protein